MKRKRRKIFEEGKSDDGQTNRIPSYRLLWKGSRLILGAKKKLTSENSKGSIIQFKQNLFFQGAIA